MFFKVKIAIIGVAVLIALLLGVYIATVIPLDREVLKESQISVERASRLVERSQELRKYDLIYLAEHIAAQAEFVAGVQVAEEKERRAAVFDAINQYDEKLKNEGRKPDFLGVVDKQGQIIARDLDINNMYGDRLDYRNVKASIQGTASADIWMMKNLMMRAAAAPIKAGTQIVGAVIVAYDFTAAEARIEAEQFGTHVAYFINKGIRASSFTITGEASTEDTSKVEAMNQKLFGVASLPGEKAIAEKKSSDIFEMELQNDRYLAITGPLMLKQSNHSVGYLVLTSLSQAREPLSRIRWMLFIFGVGSILVLVFSLWGLARQFVNGQDNLELGVAEIINGNTEYTFEAVKEFEGLANALNVMIARLLGRPEPGDEDNVEEGWRADVLNIEEPDADATDEELSRHLMAEPEDAYFQRLFQEYFEARRNMSLPTEGITLESFTQKVRANEALLKAKHKCQMVRFVVNTDSGRVSLKTVRFG